MISFLQGKIEFRTDKFLVIDANGVGYKVFCSDKVLEKLSGASKGRLFTHLIAKENCVELYGFLTPEELELFEILIGISGIGPKAAMNIVSIGPPEEFKKAVEKGDTKFFSGIPGLGRKKIQKIILELSGKLVKPAKREQAKDKNSEAIQALTALGFSKKEAKQAVALVPEEIEETGEVVKEALKRIGRV